MSAIEQHFIDTGHLALAFRTTPDGTQHAVCSECDR